MPSGVKCLEIPQVIEYTLRRSRNCTLSLFVPLVHLLTPLQQKKQTVAKKFVVDTSAPVENGVFDSSAYAKYLIDHIKVDGRVGNLGEDIKVEEEGSKIVIISTAKFSGKYLKYLSKRYLKKNQIRDWIRFISVKKNTYQLTFYSVAADEEEDEE